MENIACNSCRRPYPTNSVPYRCPTCGGLYDFMDLGQYKPQRFEPDQIGIWKYRHTFHLPEDAPHISLGEGNTPLVWAHVHGRDVAFKLEYLNPSGSFKDRGTATMVSFLASRGVKAAVEDSSGNAGASFAAYAARAGIAAKVFVPDYASGPKRAQIEIHGAELVRILGPRSNASEAVRRAADQGAVYASHAHLPFGLDGFSTVAFEIIQQLNATPGSVIVPAGQGSLLLAVGRGFEMLKNAGEIDRLPTLVGVQASACAPLWAVFTAGSAGLGWVTEGQTRAEGVRIKHPLRGDAVLQAIDRSAGKVVAVEENEIIPGRDHLARLGFFVEPTSAIVWGALKQVAGFVPEPIVVILTGSGFKAIS